MAAGPVTAGGALRQVHKPDGQLQQDNVFRYVRATKP
jgi:hypothetical protein